jgi:hypothetical protein
VFDFCGLKKCLSCIGDKKAGGRYFMVSLWASVLVDMIRREFDRQESREDEMLEALRNVRTLAEKSGVAELIAEVDDYLAQLAQEDYNDKRFVFYTMTRHTARTARRMAHVDASPRVGPRRR